MYAAHRSEGCGSLLLLNPAPPFVDELRTRLWANMAARRTRADDAEKEAIEASASFAERDPKTLERYILNIYLPFFNDRASVEQVAMDFTQITAANVLAADARTYADLEALDPLASLSRIECPAMVVHAELDPVPEEFARLIADRIDSAEYRFLDDANHFVHVEDPARLRATVMPFLRRHAAPWQQSGLVLQA